MARPPKRTQTFEKLLTGDFVFGTISDIEYDKEHKFSFKGEEKIDYGIRFVFIFDGYHYPHKSRWMKFNVGEKSNLYQKYIAKLVNNAKPDMDFDLDILKGMKIKAIWEDNGDFQNLDGIWPNGSKVTIPSDLPEESTELEPF